MTPGVDRIFVDTNVLVYASIRSAPLHVRALERLRSFSVGGSELWISRQVLREYLAVLSRPQSFVTPVPSSRLVADVRAFSQRFTIAEDGPGVTEVLLSMIDELAIGGRQIHDANIVATMRVAGLRKLLTHNVRDFERYQKWLNILPLDAAK